MGKGFNEIDCDPPPYDQINNVDEFQAERSSTVPSVPILHQPILVSPISPQTLPLSPTQEENSDNYQNDIFKKPPKFLLYPSQAKEGSSEDRSVEVSQQARPLATPAPFVAARPQPIVATGVTMSASQLPQQVNAPVLHSYVRDDYLPRYSYRMICPNCGKPVSSVVQYVSGQMTHLLALVACWLTCCLACVPYFIDDLKDAEHICPACRGVLGYNRKKIF